MQKKNTSNTKKLGLFGLVTVATLGATALANAETYTVQKGDTLSAIAKKNGTTVDEIVSKNGIQDANKISIGQNLTINETTEEIMKNMFSLYQESIKQVYSSLDIDVLKSMADEIIHKKRIFLFSYGDTQTTVINFTNKLVKVNIFPTLATQFGEERHISKRMNKDDYALIISYRGQERLLECVQTLSKNHVKIGLITANKKNSLMAYCDDLIMIPDCEKENRISTFYSQLAFQYVLSNLYAIIYHQVND